MLAGVRVVVPGDFHMYDRAVGWSCVAVSWCTHHDVQHAVQHGVNQPQRLSGECGNSDLNQQQGRRMGLRPIFCNGKTAQIGNATIFSRRELHLRRLWGLTGGWLKVFFSFLTWLKRFPDLSGLHDCMTWKQQVFGMVLCAAPSFPLVKLSPVSI